MVAGTIEAWSNGLLCERDKRWLRGGVWFFGPVAAVFAAVCIVGPCILRAKTGLQQPVSELVRAALWSDSGYYGCRCNLPSA